MKNLNLSKATIWYVRGTEGGFYSRIYENGYIRYDLQVMKLANSLENKMTKILDKMEKTQIVWYPNKVVIINNWNTLHFRPALLKAELGKRILQRINIQ